MPRRGDRQHWFPAVPESAPPPGRIGIRLVRATDQAGSLREIRFNPNEFRCAKLAGELADEWADYAEISRISPKSVALGRRAIRNFCTKVDILLGGDASQASLSGQHPDIAAVLAEWERTLPTGYRAGSTTPAAYAGTVRALIARRGQHDQRPVSPNLRRLVNGAIGVASGSSQELDEFTRHDKRALVRVAWAWAQRLDARLAEGWPRLPKAATPPSTAGPTRPTCSGA
jgi:hypothetical protein